MKNIIVVSHRRSGTHFTVDSLINNFDIFSKSKDIKNSTLDSLFDSGSEAAINRFIDCYQTGGRVIKTHSTFDYWDYFTRYAEYKDTIDGIFQCPYKIYIYRGGFDVLVSLYRYQSGFSDRIKAITFYEFLREPVHVCNDRCRKVVSKPAYWAAHLMGWIFQDQVLPLKFDNLKIDFDGVINKIANYVGEELPASAKNVGMEKERDGNVAKKTSEGVNRTSVSFYAGRIGDHREFFSKSDFAFFRKEVASVSNELLRFCE